MIEIKPYKDFKEMKYGEADIFTHKPVVREILNPSKFVIRLYTDELSFLDENGYPVMGKIFVTYKPSKSVLDRKTFKLLINRIRHESMNVSQLIDYISTFFNELINPTSLTLQVNLSKPYKQDKLYYYSEEKVNNVVRENKKLENFHVDIYYPRSKEEMTDKEREIFTVEKLDIVPIKKKENSGYYEERITQVTFLNKYTGFPEYCDVFIRVNPNKYTINKQSDTLRKMLYKLRYTYLTEEEFVNYVATLLNKLNSKYFLIEASFNARGSVKYDIQFLSNN